MAIKVRLKPGWPGNFRRSVRDEDGQVRKTMVFSPGVEVELTEEEHEACGDAIPHALEVLDHDERPEIVEPQPKSAKPTKPAAAKPSAKRGGGGKGK